MAAYSSIWKETEIPTCYNIDIYIYNESFMQMSISNQ